MMIINDDPRVVNKLEASHIDDARVVIYDRHMFIVQATGHWMRRGLFWERLNLFFFCLSF